MKLSNTIFVLHESTVLKYRGTQGGNIVWKITATSSNSKNIGMNFQPILGQDVKWFSFEIAFDDLAIGQIRINNEWNCSWTWKKSFNHFFA